MGFLDRLFGHKPDAPAQAGSPATADKPAQTQTQTQTIPAERVGLHGEYDESGLAKRVAKAFDDNTGLKDHGHLWIAQHNTTVVLKGKIGSKEELDQMVQIAKSVNGTSAVETNQVTIGL